MAEEWHFKEGFILAAQEQALQINVCICSFSICATLVEPHIVEIMH